MKAKAIKVENREGIEVLISHFRDLNGELVSGICIGDGDDMQFVSFTPRQFAELINASHTIMLGFSQASLEDEPTEPNEESACEPKDETPRVIVVESESNEQISIGVSKALSHDKVSSNGVFLNIEDIDGKDHPVFFTTHQAVDFAAAFMDITCEAQRRELERLEKVCAELRKEASRND